LYGCALGYAASVVAFYVVARYRFPLVPLLLPFAAAAVVGVPRLLDDRRWRVAGGGAAIVVVAAVIANWPIVPIDLMRATGRLNAGNMILADSDDFGGAIAQYREAARLAPGAATIHDALGAALARAGKHGEAIPHFVAAIKLERAFESPWFHIATS